MTAIVFHRSCRLCHADFDAGHASTGYCSERCRYIAARWQQHEYKFGTGSMSQDEAVDHYGELFDDPLRLIRHTRHAHIIRRIYDWCVAHDTETFTCTQVAELHQSITSPMLGRIAKEKRHPFQNTGDRVSKPSGGSEAVWRMLIGFEVV